VSKRLQVNAGLRYEYLTPFSGGWNVANSNNYFNPTYIAKKGHPMYNPDHTDFSPRLGLVFDVFGDQKRIALPLRS
jgi:outer membrane receptor protein involved in Fe transport